MLSREELMRYAEAYVIASKYQFEVDIDKLEKRLGFKDVSDEDYKKIEELIRNYQKLRED